MDVRAIVTGALVAALIVLSLTLAFAEDARKPQTLPDGSYTCADVKRYVATYGEPFVLKWARRFGYTPAQIEWARRCLK